MARTKVNPRHPIGPLMWRKNYDAGSGTDEGLSLEHRSYPSFSVVLKDIHFCFPDGSEYLGLPRDFDVMAGMRCVDWIEPGDWVKLKVVDDPSFKCEAVLVYNKRERRFEIADGFENLVDSYMLTPGNRLSFTLVNVEPFEFRVKMSENGSVNESSDENEEKVIEEETATELGVASRKKHRHSKLKTARRGIGGGSGNNGAGGPSVGK